MIVALIQLIFILAIVGVLWWLASTYIPGPPPIKILINVLAALVVVLILWEAFGGLSIPHIR